MSWQDSFQVEASQGWQSSFQPDDGIKDLRSDLGGTINLPFQHPPEPLKYQMKQDMPSQFAGGVLAFGQGGMPVFDEAGAAAGAGIESLGGGGMIGGAVAPEGTPWGGIYDKRLQNIRGTERAFSQEHPNIDTGLRLAGAVAGTLPAAEALAARPILGGAAYGGSQGFTGSEGGFGNRLFSGTVGAGLGAGTAAAIKYTAPLVLDALAPVNEAGEKVLLPSQKYLKNIRNKIESGGVTPEDYALALSKSSSNEFAAEAGGEPLRVYAQSQAKLQGPNMQAAREAMRERMATAPQRTQGILEDTFGPQYNIDDAQGTIAQLYASEPELYKAAQGTVSRETLNPVLQTDAGQTALKDAAINIGNRKQIPLLNEPNIPINQAHELAKALGDQVPRDSLTGAITKLGTGAPIESLRKDVINALRRSSPEFDLAQTAAADARGFEDAFSRGRALAKMVAGEKADDVLERVAMNDMQQPYSVAGFHKGLLDTTSQVPLGTGNPAGKIANQALIDKTTELVGGDKAQGLANALMKEKSMIEFAQRGLGNSATAETASAAGAIPLSKQGVLSKVVDSISEWANKTGNQRLASLLYSTDPAEKAVLARALMQKTYFPQYGSGMPLVSGALSVAPALPAQLAGALYNQRGQQ